MKHPLRIDYSSYGYVTQAADPDDEWSRDSTGADSSPDGILLCLPSEATLTVPFEPACGETLYLLWCTRSTGDSFGHDSGIFEPIAAFRTPWKAQAAMAAVRAHYDRAKNDKMRSNYSCYFYDEAGMPFCAGGDWIGYFESLDSLDVTPFELGATEAYKKSLARAGEPENKPNPQKRAKKPKA